MKSKYDIELDIATANTRLAKTWRNRKVKWSAIVDKCRHTRRTSETVAEYARMDKDEQSAIKDVGGFVGGYLNEGKRKTSNVRLRSMATLDIDYGTDDVWDDFTMEFDCAALLYSTHKHTPETPRYRIVIPFKRPVTPEEYEPICRRIAERMGIDLFDVSTYQTARLFYWPSTSSDGQYVFECQEGKPLDPDAVLRSYVNYADVSEWPMGSREKNVIRHEIHQAEDPMQKKGVIGAFCRTYTIEEAIAKFLGDVYEPTAMEGRYTYKAGSMAGGLICYDGKFAYSFHETDPAGRMLCNAFDLVRIHLFGHLDKKPTDDITDTLSYKKMSEFAAADKDTRRTMTRERVSSAREDFEDMDGDEDDEAWMGELDCDRHGNPKSTALNVLTILEHDGKLKGRIRYNEFTGSVDISGDLPWRSDGRQWRDSDNAQLRIYLERVYGITGKEKVKDAKVSYTDTHSFHPIRDYLNGLRWDGTKRLERALIDYLGAEDCELNRTCTAMWLTAAVARIMEPGCKWDSVLMLQGPQGSYKSTWFEVMGGEGYNGNLSATNFDKNTLEQLRGCWIAEMQELDQMARAESSATKAFISNTVDVFRGAYKEDTERHQRQCIFGGSTNDAYFLKDDTGNRRFWLVTIDPELRKSESPREDLIRDRDQILAEAVAMYRAKGKPTVLPERLEQQMEMRRSSVELNRLDPTDALIDTFLDTRLPVDWDSYTIDQRQAYYKNGEDIKFKGVTVRDRASAAEFIYEYMQIRKEDTKSYRTLSKKFHVRMKREEGWFGPVTSRHVETLYGRQKAFTRKAEEEDEEDL